MMTSVYECHVHPATSEQSLTKPNFGRYHYMLLPHKTIAPVVFYFLYFYDLVAIFMLLEQPYSF